MPGIGKKAASLLADIRIHTVKDAKKLSPTQLKNIFGIRGDDLYQRLRGIDDNPVVIQRDVKSIGKEHTFSRDTRSPEEILSVFENLVSQVDREVREKELSFRTITIVCRFQGFETHTKSKTLPKVIKSKGVFQKEATTLLLRFLTENLKPVRLIGVRVNILF
tara:strand:- start:264 stop:752 length:489 start_codon:yes stop_codon:yes gene_type:complete